MSNLLRGPVFIQSFSSYLEDFVDISRLIYATATATGMMGVAIVDNYRNQSAGIRDPLDNDIVTF